MYNLRYSNTFRKDVKRCFKRGYNIKLLEKAINLLCETGTLPSQYQPHPLHGKFEGCMECHILSDWLLIWKQNDRELQLLMLETGTHSDLF